MTNQQIFQSEITDLVHRVFPPNVLKSIKYTKVSYTIRLKPSVKIHADYINYLEMWTHSNMKYIVDNEILMIMFAGYDIEIP